MGSLNSAWKMTLSGLIWAWLCISAVAVVPLTEAPIPQRMALADCVVVGKVVELESEMVEAFPLLKLAGSAKLSYRIAVVAVDSSLIGEPGLTKIRVGFVAPPPGQENAPRFRRLAKIKLSVGRQGCFFLRKHPDESFLVAEDAESLMDKAVVKEFDKGLELARRCSTLLKKPSAGLTSKNAEDRWLIAAALIYRYRSPRFAYKGAPKTEAVDVTESAAVLAALYETDWSEETAEKQLSPLRLFVRLGLTEQDGWISPGSAKDWPAAARTWLKEKGSSYRIQRFVPE